MQFIKTHSPYTLGTDLPLDQQDVDQLIRLFQKVPNAASELLGGRTSVVRTNLAMTGPVVIKYYQRGGLIRYLIRDTYLRSGKPRPRIEYEMMKKVNALGVSCPEPLIWAIKGSLFYKAYLVTREIIGQKSLADLCTGEEDFWVESLKKTAQQVAILIENRIHHVDLHPGNVLVDEKGETYIIDFDKAYESRMKQEKLMEVVIKRWNRAVLKYNLPEKMSNILEREVRVCLRVSCQVLKSSCP